MVENHKTVALITGATGVIGYAIARALAATPNYALVLLARDEDRATKAVDAIRRDTGNDDVRFRIADVSRRQSIQSIADDWNGLCVRTVKARVLHRAHLASQGADLDGQRNACHAVDRTRLRHRRTQVL